MEAKSELLSGLGPPLSNCMNACNRVSPREHVCRVRVYGQFQYALFLGCCRPENPTELLRDDLLLGSVSGAIRGTRTGVSRETLSTYFLELAADRRVRVPRKTVRRSCNN